MLYSDDGHRWEAKCSECFAVLPVFDGTRADAVAFVAGDPHHWELRDGGVLWCVECARRFREVPRRFGRGRRR